MTCGAPAFALTASNTAAPATMTDDYGLQLELSNKIAIRDALKAEIAQIDSEISRCNKAKTNWTAATIVGGVGVVGTGIGAIVQHNQIQDKREVLNDLKQ
jgi:flagellar motor component MotA